MFRSTAIRRMRDVTRPWDEGRIHIQLRDLPRSALPTDVRRLCIRERLLGVTAVAIDYHRFLPTGRAYLTLAHTNQLYKNLQALQKSSVASLPVHAVSSPPPQSKPGLRNRNGSEVKVLSGNGPHGGIHSRMKHVVIWGFPGKMSESAVENYLDDFRLDNVEGLSEAVKVELPSNSFSLYSRYLVRPTSTAEAHRLVRQLHMSYYEPEQWGKRYQLRARVVY